MARDKRNDAVDSHKDKEATAAGTTVETNDSRGGEATKITFAQAMEEVEIRFLLNIPEEELQSVDRLFFQIEQAHWFYEDFFADNIKELPHMQLATFAQNLFNYSKLLKPLQPQFNSLFKDFQSYKFAVPVYGCVLLNPNMDKVVLICNWQGTSWSLPKGKRNQNETPIDCAARESYEECGFDSTGRLCEENSFTVVSSGKGIKYYIVPDVPEDFKFEPQTRKEVSDVKFFKFDGLPDSAWGVGLCIAHVKRWASKNKKKRESEEKRSASAQRSGEAQGNYATAVARRKLDKDLRQMPNGSRSRSAPTTRGKGGAKGGDPSDVNNMDTFGAPDASTWKVEDMFTANEAITGKKFTYNGDPQRFGEYNVSVKSPGRKKQGGGSSNSASSSASNSSTSTPRKGRKGGKREVVELKEQVPTSTKGPDSSNVAELAPAIAMLMSYAASLHTTNSNIPPQAQPSPFHKAKDDVRVVPFPTPTTTTTGLSSSTGFLVDEHDMGLKEARGEKSNVFESFQFDTTDILSALKF